MHLLCIALKDLQMAPVVRGSCRCWGQRRSCWTQGQPWCHIRILILIWFDLKYCLIYKSVVSPTRDLWFEGFLAKASWDAVSPCCSSREGGRPKNYCSQWEMLPKYYIERFANNFGQFWLTMRDALKILHWKISQQCWTILVDNERCFPNNRGEFPDMLNM